ncbi:MAG: hypothetical protein JW754_02950 [Candidatus Aenigmarchaeota archaeon]|nr:hypothetical protein [Candidatus Aenigmarchaeota archaeon]
MPKGYGELPSDLVQRGAITRGEVMEQIGMNPKAGRQISLLHGEYASIFGWQTSDNGIEYTTKDRVNAFLSLHQEYSGKGEQKPKSVSGPKPGKKSSGQDYQLQGDDMPFQEFMAQINELKPEGVPLSQAALNRAVRFGHEKLPDYVRAETVKTSTTRTKRMSVVHGGAKYIASLKGEETKEPDLSEQSAHVLNESVGETGDLVIKMPNEILTLVANRIQEMDPDDLEKDEKGRVVIRGFVSKYTEITIHTDYKQMVVDEIRNSCKTVGNAFREDVKKKDMTQETE